MLYKDYVETMNLADVLHQLELACYLNNYKIAKFHYEICEILLAVDPDGAGNFMFQEGKS